MKIRILAIAKKPKSWVKEGEGDFFKRIRNFTKIEIELIPPLDENSFEIQKTKKLESEKILTKIRDDEFVIACERLGESLDSESFARKLEKLRDDSRKIVFVIGGSHGFDSVVLEKANLQISFSQLTFPHELFRMMLLEQIYRAFTIFAGKKYHK
ncbi:23S rRNA (pseudouridine(1915)-N(3))-methyltransferase RlmH [Candidatus Gracilibacteria bacterium]|nr:23S rRNA (pseudouridine(1915)-N(3))-methyltransferase RlmH [Candidatus Gracilibacteria bacterium]